VVRLFAVGEESKNTIVPSEPPKPPTAYAPSVPLFLVTNDVFDKASTEVGDLQALHIMPMLFLVLEITELHSLVDGILLICPQEQDKLGLAIRMDLELGLNRFLGQKHQE